MDQIGEGEERKNGRQLADLGLERLIEHQEKNPN